MVLKRTTGHRDMSAIRPTNLLATVRHLGLPRRTFVYLFLLNLLGAGLDLLGVVLLLPILEIIQAGGGAAIDKLQGQHWTILRNVSAQIGIPISLGLLLFISFYICSGAPVHPLLRGPLCRDGSAQYGEFDPGTGIQPVSKG